MIGDNRKTARVNAPTPTAAAGLDAVIGIGKLDRGKRTESIFKMLRKNFSAISADLLQ
ncbi:hypothetical protein [Burkholderia dolosa]|uniref:hypothetical protein n=1 Tax=Burkholderia dolosa TaxID=152500 RepID=UPI0027D29EB3|nr:hypothetical protein [Burkholderia dolosa]